MLLLLIVFHPSKPSRILCASSSGIPPPGCERQAFRSRHGPPSHTLAGMMEEPSSLHCGGPCSTAGRKACHNEQQSRSVKRQVQGW